MNKLEILMYALVLVLFSSCVYLGYHDIKRTERWKAGATRHGCAYVSRSLDDYHQILIECDGIIHSESAKTYGAVE